MDKEIERIQSRLKELEGQLAAPDFASSSDFVKTSQEYVQLKKIVDTWEELQKAERQLEENIKIVEANEDSELVAIATDENSALRSNIENWKLKIENFVHPANPMDNKSIIMEIRPAAGGEESALFGEELLRMYSRFAESKGYSLSPIDISHSDLGGIKSAIVEVSGLGAYSNF